MLIWSGDQALQALQVDPVEDHLVHLLLQVLVGAVVDAAAGRCATERGVAVDLGARAGVLVQRHGFRVHGESSFLC